MRYLITTLLLLIGMQLSAQQHYERVFNVEDVDWEGRTQGQYNQLNQAAAVELNGWWYFPAYTPEDGIAIWRTDLSPSSTEMFYKGNAPSPKFSFGDYLIFEEYTLDLYSYFALDLNTKEEISLLEGRQWQYPSEPLMKRVDDYFVLAHGNQLVIQDLTKLPGNDPLVVELPQSCRSIFDLGDGRIFAFTDVESFKVDLASGELLSFNEQLSTPAPVVRFAGKWMDKYYIQFQKEWYKEIYLIETDVNFQNVRYLDTMVNSNVLRVSSEGIILSNYIDGQCTIDLVAASTGSLISRLVTARTSEYSNWSAIEALPDGGYLLTIDQQSEALYVHFQIGIAKPLIVDNLAMDIIYSSTILEKGVLLGYATETEEKAEMFFFDYKSLSSKQVLPGRFFTNEFGRFLKLVYAPLGGNSVMALLYDEQISFEPAIIDVDTESFYYLQDFNTEPFSAVVSISFHEMLSNSYQLISFYSIDAFKTVLFQPETQEIIDLKNWYDGKSVKVDVGLVGGQFYPSTSFVEHGAGLPLVELGGLLYFAGSEEGLSQPGIYELDIEKASLRRVAGIDGITLLFTAGDQLYIVNRSYIQYEFGPRKIYRLIGDELISIFEANETTIQDNYNLNQYFFFKDKLFFSHKGDLLTYDKQSGQLETVFKDISESGGTVYPYDVTRYGNFIVLGDELYFTASSENVLLVFGIFFFGLEGPKDYRFVKTDGTISGTTLLPIVPNSTQNYGRNFLSLFVLNDEIFMTLQPQAQEFFGAFKFSGTAWQPVEVYENGVLLQESISVLYDFAKSNHKMSGRLHSPSNLTYQRIPIIYDGQPFMYGTDVQLINNVRSTKISSISFDGVIRLQTRQFYFPNWDGGDFLINDFVISGNKLLVVKQSGGLTAIYEFNFDTGRSRIVVSPDDGLVHYYQPFLQKDEVSGDVFFLSAPFDAYGLKDVNRLKFCPALDPVGVITSLNDSICQGEPWLLQIERPASSPWIFITENGVGVPINLFQVNDIFSTTLPFEKGVYTLSFYLDNGCEEAYLQDLSVTIGGTIPDFPDIIITPATATSIFYSTDILADSYEWNVTNGTLVSGQNTNQILVDWGASVSGWVQLQAKNDFCSSEVNEVNYFISTSVDQQTLRYFDVFPNPATYLVQIKSLEHSSGFHLRVYSIDGQVIEARPVLLNDAQLDVSAYKTGTYLIELQNEAGVFRKKLSVLR
jgi:hypothetical protein